jgi:hypothetical protein
MKRAEVPDEPGLIVGGELLAPHQEQVVLAEEPAQLDSFGRVAFAFDVEVHQPGAQRTR